MSFTIKELEALSGIKAHTIRIWEQRYNFLKPSRTTTNIRTYSSEELKTILTVALLNKHGYKISRINNMAPVQRRLLGTLRVGAARNRGDEQGEQGRQRGDHRRRAEPFAVAPAEPGRPGGTFRRSAGRQRDS